MLYKVNTRDMKDNIFELEGRYS